MTSKIQIKDLYHTILTIAHHMKLVPWKQYYGNYIIYTTKLKIEKSLVAQSIYEHMNAI